MPEDLFREWIGVPCRKKSQAVSQAADFCMLIWVLRSMINTERQFKQYLAVSTLDPATQPNRTGGLLPDLKGSIQIWSIEPGTGNNDTGLPDSLFEPGYDVEMRCALVICFEGGPVIDFKWMPLGCCDPVSLVHWLDPP